MFSLLSLIAPPPSPLPLLLFSFQIFLREAFGRKQQISAGLDLEAVSLVSEGTSYNLHLSSSVQEMERLCFQQFEERLSLCKSFSRRSLFAACARIY